MDAAIDSEFWSSSPAVKLGIWPGTLNTGVMSLEDTRRVTVEASSSKDVCSEVTNGSFMFHKSNQ